MPILGVETSCDETAVAIYDLQRGLLAHQIYSQIDIHAPYGGVVPELASRDHIRKTLPLIEKTIADANLKLQELTGIAYTAGPGLLGGLIVGATLARSLGFALNIPTLGIHHLEGHLLAIMLEEHRPEFPFLTLLVSGGHTLLIEVQAVGNYKILGESLDDAAGEAFDKTARLLGLNNAGGAALATLAQHGNAKRFIFPRPMTDRPGLDFSFSGLKTCAVTTLQTAGNDDQTRADIAYAFEEAIIATLAIKCKRALKQTNLKRLVIAGGVGANHKLRHELKLIPDSKVYFPRPEFCTDNGAMIAYAGALRINAGQKDELKVSAKARWSLEELITL